MKTLDELGISPTPWAAKSTADFAVGKPWDDHYVVSATGGVVALCKNHPHPAADTRFIEAAPDMYAALHLVCRWLVAEGSDTEVLKMTPVQIRKVAFAALVKAGGEDAKCKMEYFENLASLMALTPSEKEELMEDGE